MVDHTGVKTVLIYDVFEEAMRVGAAHFGFCQLIEIRACSPRPVVL